MSKPTCACAIAFAEGDNPHQRIEGMRIEFCPLHEHAGEMLEALKIAVIAIEALHGEVAWEIYRDHSPEMKAINGAIAKAEGKGVGNDPIK